jgi:molybdenum cofactor biosynthesis enzyme MoaA
MDLHQLRLQPALLALCLQVHPNPARRVLRLANVQRLVDEAVALGFDHIFFTGGEPFVLNDIYNLLTYWPA